MHPNKAVVALAAKMARIVWVVLTKAGALYERRERGRGMISCKPVLRRCYEMATIE